MAEIIFRLPSKTIQYGYVEVKATPKELGGAGLLGDPEELGALYAIYVGRFLEGEQRGMASYLGAPQVAPKPEVDREPEAEPGDPQVAAQKLIECELGGVVVEEQEHTPDAPPWLAPPSAEAKPWESGGVKPTVAQIEW